MLRVASNSDSAYPRLLIEGVPVKAWIEHKPWRYGSTDWQLWYERRGQLSRGKCQLRLEVESRLRAWLLRYHGMPLSTLSFEELWLIALGKGIDARRIHARKVDAVMPRLTPTPIPSAL